MSFIDDYTKYCWLFSLLQKSAATSTFINFRKMIKYQFNAHLRTIYTNGSGEYLNNILKSYCNNWGINHQFTCPYTPAQNGVAE